MTNPLLRTPPSTDKDQDISQDHNSHYDNGYFSVAACRHSNTASTSTPCHGIITRLYHRLLNTCFGHSFSGNTIFANSLLSKMGLATASLSLLLLCSMNTMATCNPLGVRHILDEKQLWQDITELSTDKMQGRKTATAGAKRAQQYIQQRFKQLNLVPFNPDYRHPFAIESLGNTLTGVNMIGLLKANTEPQRLESGQQTPSYIVLTAHYDHLGQTRNETFNGADDNASGVAALFAIARYFEQHPTQQRHHGFIFVATDGEELGLFGAKAFLEQPPVAIADIAYNINMDMISQPDRRQRLYIGGTRLSSNLNTVEQQSIEQASLCLVVGHNGSGRSYDRQFRINWRAASDHYAFFQKGIPYLFFSVNDHQYYHSPKDTIDKVNQSFYFAAVETILQSLILLDSSPAEQVKQILD